MPYRGEDRGAAPMRVGGVWREEVVRTAEYVGMGVPLPTGGGSGRVLCLLQKKIDFASQIGELWCKLSAFCTVQVNHLKLV